MSDFSIYEKMRCADRETRLRRMFYDKLIEQGRMSRDKADYQLGCIKAIADDYRSKWDGVIPNLDVDERFMV